MSHLQLSQKRDIMYGQESLAMKIKAWIPIKKIQLPSKPESAFEWFHAVEDTDSFKTHRNLCCQYFNLDMNDKSQKSEFVISFLKTHFLFLNSTLPPTFAIAQKNTTVALPILCLHLLQWWTQCKQSWKWCVRPIWLGLCRTR